MDQTLEAIDTLIAARQPSYFITANLYYAMLADADKDLAAITRRAAFVLADGMPLVWASKHRGRRLPERVTGSDMIFRLSERAAERGYRLFFLGGAPGVGEEAAHNLQTRYPGLQVVGIESPDNITAMPEADMAALVDRIHAARPDILLVALGQPKGERWIDKNLERLAVPVCAQVGASIDFAAGRVRRAPRWMQKTGLEWLFRMLQEPKRLAPRYAANIAFLFKMLARDLTGGAKRERERSIN
jgi:N-acetylglucosaminyldiphosphoundecaprenol N-acetyl-beta-D-mannosaminyltransferase